MDLLFSAGNITKKVKSLGKTISRDYQSKKPHLLVVLKGSFIFASDLARNLSIPFDIDFIRISTYGDKSAPDTKPSISLNNDIKIENKDILVIDDILDTGNTLFALKRFLISKNARSVKVCTLLDKACRREADIIPDYFGFKIGDGFVVGYGLDYAESYRGLPSIYVLNNEEISKGRP